FLGKNCPTPVNTFLVRRRCREHHRPLRPWIIFSAFFRRLYQKLNLSHTARALAIGSTHAVRSGITTANYHDVLAGGYNIARKNPVASYSFVLLGEKLHCEVNTVKVSSRYWEIARSGSTPCQEDCIELIMQQFRANVHTYVRVGTEHHAFHFHDADTTIDHLLLQLEIGNTISQ